MDRAEFIESARECGYTDEELQNLLQLHDDLKMPYEEIPLEVHNVD